MASQQKYCLCGQPHDNCKFMIQCDHCKEWFHGSCVTLKEYEARDLEKFHCPRCQPSVGVSIMKERKNWHRHDYWDTDAAEKPVQSGTATFIRELKQKAFPSADEEVVVVRGQQLTLPYFVQNGFDKPILIPSKDGLGLLMPPDTFTVNDIMDYVGEDCSLDAIDVGRQEDIKMQMKDWVTYYNSPERDKVYNVISLEFSGKRLSELVRPPSIIQKLSWVESFWPDPNSAISKKLIENAEDLPSRPQVMKYCLMGTEDSYTDFHIDFGGTSVWYHVLQGEKVFYLIRPSPENLEKYENWMISLNQNETFFGDMVDVCYKLVISRGQTLFIPSGWIHSVLTPVDSLVFGGNFLCSMNIPLQLKVHDMEGRIKTPHKYKFPSFEDVHWYAAPNIAQHLRDFNDGNRRAPSYLLQGCKTIINLLKTWLSDKEEKRKFPPPPGLNPQKILKDLGREVRMAERQLTVKGRADREKRIKDLIASPVKTKKSLPRRSVQPLTPKTSNIESVEINVLNEQNVLDNVNVRLEEANIVKPNNAITSDDEKSSPVSKSGVVPLSPSKSPGTIGRTFATTNAARRKAAAANRSNALKMKLNAEGKIPTREASHGVPDRIPNSSSRNVSLKDSVYDFVDSDEDTLIVDEKPKGKKRGSSSSNVQTPSCDIANSSLAGAGMNGNFKQRMIARNELSNKPSPSIVTTSEGLPIARKSAPGPLQSPVKQPLPPSEHAAHGTLRLKLSVNGTPPLDESYHQLQPLREVNAEGFSVEPGSNFPPLVTTTSTISAKNGGTLDTLLLACDYAGDPESSHISLEDDLSNSGRASPSTREAIQGMLSMSKSAFTFGAQNVRETETSAFVEENSSTNNSLSSLMDSRLMGLSLLASKCTTNNSSRPSSPNFHPKTHTIGKRGMTQVNSRIGTRSVIGKRKFPKEEDDFEASLKHCHQDKDYIYFDLDTTEEDQNIFKKRGGKSSHDESWSPRARVNISCPKPERPTREGARKEAIESGLAAAAAKLADLPPPKRPYHRKKPSHPPMVKKEVVAVEVFDTPSTSSASPLVINTSSVKRTPSTGDTSPPQSQGVKKPRKGFATAKQRLGKILKIHKMLH